MSRSMRSLKILVFSLLLLQLAACASTQQWSAAGGDRQQGVVRLAYEYPEFHQPAVSEAQAEALALNRCNSWGYRKVEPIAGQVRECANVDDGNCNLWTVTREFQCSGGAASYASRLSR
jgi:YecR-like lipoprotein